MGKIQYKAFDLLEEMAMNIYQWLSERILPRKVVELHETDAIIILTTQVASFTKQLQSSWCVLRVHQFKNLT